MIIVVEVINVKKDEELLTMVEYMEGWIKRLVENQWVGVTVEEGGEEGKAMLMVSVSREGH